MADPLRYLLPDALAARVIRIHSALYERSTRHDARGLGAGRLSHRAEQLHRQPGIWAGSGARHRAGGGLADRLDGLSALVQLRPPRRPAPDPPVMLSFNRSDAP